MSVYQLDELLSEALRAFRARQAGPGRTHRPVPLEWEPLRLLLGGHSKLGGLWPGCYVLTGGTGTGKSQLALQWALHCAEQGHEVVYVSLELGAVDIAARLLSLKSPGAQWSDMVLGLPRPEGAGIGDDPVVIAEESRISLDTLPITVVVEDPMTFTAERFEEIVRSKRWSMSHEASGRVEPLLVILDYLQILGSDDERARVELRERIGRAANKARAMAVECHATTLLISSTARENYGRLVFESKAGELKRPHVAELVGLSKESGEIEYACDGVIVLGRERTEERWRPGDRVRVHLGLAKGRNTPAQWMAPRLLFDGARFVLDDSDVSLNDLGALERANEDRRSMNGHPGFIFGRNDG